MKYTSEQKRRMGAVEKQNAEVAQITREVKEILSRYSNGEKLEVLADMYNGLYDVSNIEKVMGYDTNFPRISVSPTVFVQLKSLRSVYSQFSDQVKKLEKMLKEYEKNKEALFEKLLNRKFSDNALVTIYRSEVFEDDKQKCLYQFIVDFRTAVLVRKKEKVSLARSIISLYQNQKYKECFEYMEKSKYEFLSLFSNIKITDEEKQKIEQIESEFIAYTTIKNSSEMYSVAYTYKTAPDYIIQCFAGTETEDKIKESFEKIEIDRKRDINRFRPVWLEIKKSIEEEPDLLSAVERIQKKEIKCLYNVYSTLYYSLSKEEDQLFNDFMALYYKTKDPRPLVNNYSFLNRDILLYIINGNEFITPEIIGLKPFTLRNYLNKCYSGKSEEETKKIISQFMKDYTEFYDNKDIEQKLEEIRSFATRFIESDMSIQDFKKMVGMTEYRLSRLLEILSKFDPELKKQYSQTVRERKFTGEEKKQMRKEKRKEKLMSELDECEAIIREYVNSEMTIKDFLEVKGIDHNQFTHILNVVSEFNPGLKKRYSEYTSKMQSSRFAIILSGARKMAKLLQSGIIVGDKVRKYDLIDYHNSTTIQLETLAEIVHGKVSKEDYYSIRVFMKQNEKKTKLNAVDVYNTKHIVGRQKDENGNFIEGTGRELTLEENKFLIGYMKYNRLPSTYEIYRCALNRYLNGFIEFDETLVDDSTYSHDDEKVNTLIP